LSIHNTTHDLWRFFWHSIKLRKDSPILHRYISHEMDEPHRWSNSLILRLPKSECGIVIGFWRKEERTEDQAILAALGREIPLTIVSTAMDREIEEARWIVRRKMMRKQYPADDQALLVEALDL
jgi:hypothetical protein